MKILYVCSLFCQKNSSAAIRNMSLVDGLVKNGNEVRVVTLAVNEAEQNQLYKTISCDISFLGETSNTEGISFSQGLIKRFKVFNVLFNKIRPFLFFPDTHKRFIDLFQPENFGNYDIIVSSSDTKSSHFAALKLKLARPQINWIQIWGDPWAEDVTLDRISKNRIRNKEHYLLNKADKVVYISKITKEHIANKYPMFSAKIEYIPRSYFVPIYNNNIPQTKFRFLYTGVLSHGRNIGLFFEWFSTNLDVLSNSIDIFGSISEDMAMNFSKYSNINFKGSVNYEDILEEYRVTDVLLLIGNSKDSTQIPGKLYDYLGTNLPILCVMYSKDEPVTRFLKQFEQCFIVTYDELQRDSVDLEYFHRFIRKRYDPVQAFRSETVANEFCKLIG